MGFIKNKDIRGYWINEKLVCPVCVTADEGITLDGITAEDVLTDPEIDEEDLYFCDRCGERIMKA